MDKRELIQSARSALGIEFGSTRIKAVLTDYDGNVLAMGAYEWENSLADGMWTYSIDKIHEGLRGCYSELRRNVEKEYGVSIKRVGAIGISAMMHGYMAFDAKGKILTPFRTWRNSNTQAASDELTELFDFNIPLRWTIAHLYQCVLDKEEHLERMDYCTTLASYIHYRLTGERVTGIGDASGIFPVDSDSMDYDSAMVERFDDLIRDRGYRWKLRDILPKVMVAGQRAGTLTSQGAAFLDESGDLEPGIPLCPPEGDAGTGMVATNAISPRTGNVSAGTSTFAMLVLEKPLSGIYREIDMVTTPDGSPVAMAHANNGTSDLNAWVSLFGEFSELTGHSMSIGDIYDKLYRHSLEGDTDCGGLISYGYYSGEGITHINEGRPVFARTPDAAFNLANLMRTHLYSALSAVKLGLDLLFKNERVEVDRITGHGGLFTVKGVAQRYLAAAVGAPVTVMDTASQGGPWGMALLAAYMIDGNNKGSLDKYLQDRIFSHMESSTLEASPDEVRGFEEFAKRYACGLEIERAAVDAMR